MPQILIATGNPHKVEEIHAIFDMLPSHDRPHVRLVGLSDIPGGLAIPEPHEGELTFEGNAALKARYYSDMSGLPTLADDSGLAVDALGGAPGVLSARYSGLCGPRKVVDPANNMKLMEVMRGVPKELRGARFVCVLALGIPGVAQALEVTRGEFPGRLLLDAECADPGRPELGRGENGFGYDPLLWLDDAGCTSAQLRPEEKNARSHRGAAVRLMAPRIVALVKTGRLG